MTTAEVSRRVFLKGAGSLAVGFALAPVLGLPDLAKATPGHADRLRIDPTTHVGIDDAWLILTPGRTTVYSARVELGTGVQTALTQIVVEELRLGMNRVAFVQGDTVLTASAATVGSKSIQDGGPLLRQAGPLPDGFLLTLPKVTSADQVRAMVEVCERLEELPGLAPGGLRFEIQVETPQAIVGADGAATVAVMVHAAGGRCVSLHYGTYDYSAACGVAAAYQSLEHAVADHAKAVMQVAAAGTGVRLSDGSTNVVPAGTPGQVRDALRLHARLVRRSLERGYYQGWDMHPGHLVTRYLAAYAFYREGLPAAADRLRRYLSHTGGGVLDEPATAQALASFLTRGLHCGALDDAEVATATGVPREALDALARRRPLPEEPS